MTPRARERAQGFVALLSGVLFGLGLALATMGSIAEDIVRHAEVPVITVRTRHHAGCAASSCATCDLGRSEVERAIDAEDAG